MSPRRCLDGPRRWLEVIDFISLGGRLDGASMVSAVVCKSLKTFGSTVLDGPLSPTPIPPIARERVRRVALARGQMQEAFPSVADADRRPCPAPPPRTRPSAACPPCGNARRRPVRGPAIAIPRAALDATKGERRWL
jgi:hypothetical protein